MKSTLIALAAMLCLLGAVVSDAGSTRNVLLIIADDLGTDSLSSFNDNPAASFPPTPTINSLCTNGIAFTRFYAYPTCSPTRAAMMTGRYAYRTGVFKPTGATSDMLVANEFTLPEALLASGAVSNRLASIGKWHLGADADAPNTLGGWPHFSGALGGGLPNYRNWDKVLNGSTITNHAVYATTDNVNDALTWIGSQGTNAWFLWVAFNAGHTPLHRPPLALHDYGALPTAQTNIDANPRLYFEAMVQSMDTEIARLLTGVDTNETTVIFMGDNGTSANVIQQPFRRAHGKGSVYEGGVRVPMVIAGPAINGALAGTSYDDPVHAVDLYATILDLFGVATHDVVPGELILDSRSFLPVLCADPYTRSPAALMAETIEDAPFNIKAGRMIVEGAYKYIAFLDGTQELYRVDTDVAETNNLLAGVLSSNQQDALGELQSQLGEHVNVPHIYRIDLDAVDGVILELGWFANAAFTLLRSPDPATTNWQPVANQALDDGGGATLSLRDPTPPASPAYYRVSTP